jgi:predicted nucleic acid-binding protein
VGKVRAVIDTNILIDYLNGLEVALVELRRYKEPVISRITWMEVLAGTKGPIEEERTLKFLRLFRLEELGRDIAGIAVTLRREYKLKLADAVILATARHLGCILITRDSKDFDPHWPDVWEPYHL